MPKFVIGFVSASALWCGVGAVLHLGLGWGPPAPDEEPTIEAALPAAEDASETEPEDRRPRRRRGRRGAAGSSSEGERAVASRPAPTGDATTGDDLRANEMRTVDMAGGGGEQQLSPRQIESSFGTQMGRIQRCFVLAAGDDPVRGRLVFGMRIAGSGRATAVNLSGPAVLTTGACGECLRDAARAIQFPSFDGPEMIVSYPITLE